MDNDFIDVFAGGKREHGRYSPCVLTGMKRTMQVFSNGVELIRKRT